MGEDNVVELPVRVPDEPGEWVTVLLFCEGFDLRVPLRASAGLSDAECASRAVANFENRFGFAVSRFVNGFQVDHYDEEASHLLIPGSDKST